MGEQGVISNPDLTRYDVERRVHERARIADVDPVEPTVNIGVVHVAKAAPQTDLREGEQRETYDSPLTRVLTAPRVVEEREPSPGPQTSRKVSDDATRGAGLSHEMPDDAMRS
jgi:hypothetical protein